LPLELVPNLLEMLYWYKHLLPIASEQFLAPLALDISVAPSDEPVRSSASQCAGHGDAGCLQPSFLRAGGVHGGDR
jgi:hypothetical protein